MIRFLILSLLLLSGCGFLGDDGGRQNRPGTGGITAQARWPAPGFAVAGPSHEVALPADVVTVFTTVFADDIDNVENEFDAAAGEGTINDVPVGKNRTLSLEGRNSDGDSIYYAEIAGITVAD